MPWQDESFQAILCNASFHHYPKPLNILKEMRRLLVSGGTLIIGDPTAPGIIRALLNMENRHSDSGDFWIYNEKDRRSYKLELTSDGELVNKEHKDFEDEIYGKIINSLDTCEERDELLKLIEKIARNL